MNGRLCKECATRLEACRAAREATKTERGAAHPRWTEAEKTQLAEAVTQGMSREEAAAHCGRSVAGVINMHFRMGLPPFARTSGSCVWESRRDEVLALLDQGWNGARIAKAYGATRLAAYSAIYRIRGKRARRESVP
jgi:hypothetical protein